MLTRTVVNDPDGVTSVELWVQKPGASTYSKLAHGYFHYTSDWAASIDSYGDHLNSGGTLSFYAVATDGTGLKTKSATTNIGVRACDRDATVSGGIDLDVNADGNYRIPGDQCKISPVPWYFSIHDPDGRVMSAVLSLTLTRMGSSSHQSVALRHSFTWTTWFGDSTTWEGEYQTDWTLTATDVNGGTTIRSGSAKVLCVWIG